MRSIFAGSVTRRPASSVTSWVGEFDGWFDCGREQEKRNATAKRSAKIWSALKTVPRGLFLPLPWGECRGEDFTARANALTLSEGEIERPKAPWPLRFAGALQI